jgi:DNA-binding PadR family transcriptional regulator
MKGPLESTKFVILLALAAGPRHGAGIRDQIVADTLGVYLRDSTLYAALASMTKAGFIGRNGNEYQLTERGRRILEQESQTLKRATQLSQERRIIR